MLKLFIYISLYLFLNHATYLEAALGVVALSFVVAYYAATAATYGKVYAGRAVFVFRRSIGHPVKISKLRINEVTVLIELTHLVLIHTRMLPAFINCRIGRNGELAVAV